MTPIEKLKELRRIIHREFPDAPPTFEDVKLAYQSVARLQDALYKLDAELIALWEAVEKWDSLDATGYDGKWLSQALQDLNAKAKEVL